MRTGRATRRKRHENLSSTRQNDAANVRKHTSDGGLRFEPSLLDQVPGKTNANMRQNTTLLIESARETNPEKLGKLVGSLFQEKRPTLSNGNSNYVDTRAHKSVLPSVNIRNKKSCLKVFAATHPLLLCSLSFLNEF